MKSAVFESCLHRLGTRDAAARRAMMTGPRPMVALHAGTDFNRGLVVRLLARSTALPMLTPCVPAESFALTLHSAEGYNN